MQAQVASGRAAVSGQQLLGNTGHRPASRVFGENPSLIEAVRAPLGRRSLCRTKMASDINHVGVPPAQQHRSIHKCHRGEQRRNLFGRKTGINRQSEFARKRLRGEKRALTRGVGFHCENRARLDQFGMMEASVHRREKADQRARALPAANGKAAAIASAVFVSAVLPTRAVGFFGVSYHHNFSGHRPGLSGSRRSVPQAPMVGLEPAGDLSLYPDADLLSTR